MVKRQLCAVLALLVMTAVSSCSKPSAGPPVKEYKLKQSDFILNAKLWRTPDFAVGRQLEIQLLPGTGPYDTLLVRASIDAHKLGIYDSPIPVAGAHEWGYSITHLDGQTDGAGRKIATGFSGPNAPKTRAEAVTKIHDFLKRQYLGSDPHPWYSMNGHYPWHHYAGEMGFDVIGSEIGENINNYQWHIALTRGAGRQYQTQWSMDFSAWHGPSVPDVSGAAIWGVNSDPEGGHSNSLFERSMVMSYMAGADCVVAEAGGPLSFYTAIEDGVYKLSPYGAVCQKVNRFITANPDVGDGYTPFGIVLDYYHGAYSGFDGKKAFYNFNYNAGDNMTWDLINKIWPTGWAVMGRNEAGTMVNGPYGDNFDVLLQNASQETLNSYPALILSGDISLSSAEIARYQAYVGQGGILILNTAFVKFFPEFKGSGNRYDKTHGKGTVMVYGEDYKVNNLDPILKEIISKKVPVTVSDNIQYFTSIKDGSIFVTLINNEGVTKEPKAPPVVDSSKKKTVTVTYNQSLAIKSVHDIYNDKSASLSGKTVSLTVPAGGIAVLEFKFD